MSGGPRVALAESAVPKKQTRHTNMWHTYISSDQARIMRTTPGRTYQLVDPDTTRPLEIPHSDYLAMLRAAGRPFRIQTRSVTAGKAKANKGARHVWVSYDPDYWAALDAKRKETDQ